MLHVDGYAAFQQLQAARPVGLAACWAHARRRFYDFSEAGSPVATEALRRIGQLYALEEHIRGRTADERRQDRQTHGMPLVADLKTWFEQELRRVPARSKLAEA